MKQLTAMDKGFLLSESREVPMHVGGVALYTLPSGADTVEFLQSLADNLGDAEAFLPPFGDRLKTGRLGLAGPTFWEPDPALDLDYHIRHSALPQPGRYRELFTLVSRLHATLLDRNRPLWEMHLIEGLPKRQFAVYTKTHHAAVDGARSVHIARSMLSADPKSRLQESPLSLNSWQRYRAMLKRDQPSGPSDAEVRNVVEALKSSFDSGAQLYGAARRITRAWTGEDSLLLPFLKVPTSSINTSIGGARRFVAQSWPFARIRTMAKAYDGTFNDAVLAICGGALRKYLQNHSELPADSLKAMVPVSVRAEGDVDSSNAVASINADLGTNIADPAARFAAIKASTEAGKALFADMSPAEAQFFSMLLQTPGLLLMPLGLISRLPPFNTVISNVPGIRETMYWNGARLDGSYPMSIVMDGVAMNITLSTYDKNVDFGIIACRRSMPQVQRIIDYMEDALAELEEAAGLARVEAKPKSTPRRKARAKTKTKSKTKPKAKTTVKRKVKAKPRPTTKSKAKPKAKSKAKPKRR
ncbi:MAG: wax ester/triacylglycerol synthase family O-acyltransferase [Haliea sp.]|jgi:WS/DGAT/MGAT family acyltransferase|nr:wax ester/triacylglycerol synthase family O-acyltransferase [Haliea sp.]